MAHFAFIGRFVRIWRRSLPLQWLEFRLCKHQNPPKGGEDALDRKFDYVRSMAKTDR